MVLIFFALLTILIGIVKEWEKEKKPQGKVEIQDKSGEIQTIFHWSENTEVEVYSKVKVSDFVKLENGTLEDKEIDTEKLGVKKITFFYKDAKKKRKEETLTIHIVDTTPPLVWISNVYTKTKGDNKKLEESVLCGDNYDKKPICRVEGTYDTSKVGEYPLTYYAIDAEGNEIREPFTLKVIEKSNSSSSEKRDLEEVKQAYLTEETEIGIDVSKWQGDIDWKKVKDSGITFAMIRLGTQKAPKEDSVLDPYFLQNIKNAQKNGVKVGVYYYSYASSKKEATEQADWVIKNLKDQKLELPVVFDWECYQFFNSYEISIHDLSEIANTFLDKVKKEGYRPMFYASKNYLERLWLYQEYPVWLAHYTNQTTYQGTYVMWQLSSNGRVPGIEGAVDMDVLYKREMENQF